MPITKYRGPATPPTQPRSPSLPQQQPRTKFGKKEAPPEKVGISFRDYKPEGWEDVMLPVFHKGRRGPSYEMSYWEDPLNVARNYHALRAAAPGQKIPDFLDREQIENAYKYMVHVQGTDDWTNWKYVNRDDPVRGYLQNMSPPPMEWQLKPVEFQQWLAADLGGRDPSTWTDEEIYKLTPDLRVGFQEWREKQRTKTYTEDIATWQVMAHNIQSNPIMSGVSTMVPFAIGGAGVGLATAGPLGAFIGGVAPLAMGAGMGAISTISPTVAEMLMVLDVPAEEFEKTMGLGLQVYGSMIDPEAYGALSEITENIGAAYQAGTLMMTAGAGFEASLDFYDMFGGPGQEEGRWDLTNIFPAIEYALRSYTGRDTSMITFAGGMQAFPQLEIVTDADGRQYAVGQVTPVTLDTVGMAVLVQARRDMVNGEDPDAVIAEYVEKFGFSGEFTELAGHIALDPLNVLPQISSKGIGTIARIAGDVPLSRSFMAAPGPVRGWKTYQNYIRQGIVGAADELSAFQMFVGGLNETGVIKEIFREPVAGNAVKRWFAHLAGLTPEARTRTFLSMGLDNLNNLIDFRRGDPLGQGALMRAMASETPTKMAATAKFLGSPEWATLRQALPSFIEKLDDLEQSYVKTEQHRLVLTTISDITGLDKATILKLAGDADTADNLMVLLTDKVAQTSDQKLQALVDGTTTKDLRQIMDAFTGDNPAPWHPDEYSARLSVSFGEHIAEWGIERFGVTKPSEVNRFWNTMKRAQSVVLLGFNPAYAVNNIVNNTVTRAATGIWGYARPAQIEGFWSDFGYHPYRERAGTGIGGIGPDIPLGQTGEEAIRAVVTPERKGIIQKGIDVADKFGLATKLSGMAESLERMQSFYTGTRQYLNHNWKRGKGFKVWSNELKTSMQDAYPGVKNIDDIVYSVVEGSPSREIAQKRLTDMFNGDGPVHDVDVAIGRIAQDMGMDPAMVRDTLSVVYDDLKVNLEGAVTAEDYSMAYTKTKNQLRENVMERLSEDLQTRYEQVTTQVGGGSFAEASRIFSEAQLTMSEFWLTNTEAMGTLADKAWALRDAGVSESVITAMYREHMAESNMNWENHRKFERATWLGFLESMGADDADTRAFLSGVDGNANSWNDYFSLIEERRTKHFSTDYDTPAAQKRARVQMEKLNEADYLKTHQATDVVQAKIDEIFVKSNRAMYGDEAAVTAKNWKASVRELHNRRAIAQTEHRRRTVNMSGERRRVANEKFYNDTYIPIVKELFRVDIEMGSQYSGAVSGDITPIEFARPGEFDMPAGPPGTTPDVIVPEPPPLRQPGPGEVPMMLTQGIRDRLEFLGYSADEIHNMRPSEAWDNINKGRRDPIPPSAPPVEPGAVPEPGAFTQRGTTAERIQYGKNQADEIRRIAAQEYQVGSIDPTGRVDLDDLVLTRTLEKYGDTTITSLDDISPAEARRILEARKKAKEWGQSGRSGGVELSEQDIVDRSVEDVIEGRYEVAASEYVEGSIRDLPTALQSAIRWAAARMLDDFESGRGDRVKPMMTDSGQQFFRKFSDNVEWYKKLTENSQKRGTISNTLDRIINPDSPRWVNRGGDVPKGKMLTLQRIKSVVIGKLLGFVDEGFEPQPAAPGWLLHVGDTDGAIAAFKEWVDAGAIDYSPDEMMNSLGLDADGFNRMWEMWDEQIAPQEQPASAIIPVVDGLQGDVLLNMYLKKLADIEAMKKAAQELTGIKTMPEEPRVTPQEPSAIVPVGEQAIIPVGEVDPLGPVQPAPHGNYPPGYIESIIQPKYESQTGFDYYSHKVRPMLDALEAQAIADTRAGGIEVRDLPRFAQGELNKWLNETWGDMATNKIAAVRWGEVLGDEALLNYSRKRGIDESIQWLYPYQYWYTRSMLQWGLRGIDRPAWFANYSRLRNFMNRKEEEPGFPSRLRGKISVPAPYLPEWAGSDIWFDPLRKLFPIEEFTNGVEQAARRSAQDSRSAEYWLVRQYNEGQISQQDVLQAFRTKAGPNWDMAMAEVTRRNEAENAQPESWITTLMSPAAYLTYPIAMVTGEDPFTHKEPGTLPITRTGMAMETMTQDTPLQSIGKIIGGAMAAPERALRGWRGLSEFGGWGDYYMDRQVSNMVGEGVISEKEGNMAMIERSGEVWETARERVQFELMLKTPGALPVYAAGHGGDVGDVISAMMFGWMPGNLLPDGELVHRGLKDKYDTARAKFNAGDVEAMGDFFDEYPKYETRMALYKEPEERLRNFLISDVWDVYGELSSIDKKMVTEALGPLFQDGFLGDETSNYDMLDNQTLAAWLRTMGEEIPEVEELQEVSDAPDIQFDLLEYADPNDAALIDAYRAERNQLFPNWYAMQQQYYAIDKGGGSLPGATDEESRSVLTYRADRNSKFPSWFETQSQYFDLPQGQRRDFLSSNPMLEEYWDWSRAEKAANSAIKKFSGVSREGGPRAQFLNTFPELSQYWDWNKAVKAANPQIDYYTNPEKYDDREPPPHAAYNMDFIRDFTPGLTRQLFDYYYAEQPLTAGTTGELMAAWNQNDRPGGSYDEFVENILRGVVAP